MSARVLSPGDRFADHVIRRLLGAGGFGAVYEAEQPLTGRRVALKVIHPHVAEDEDARARAIQEAHALAELRHINIVSLYAAGIAENGQVWIATELLSGWTLRELRPRSGGLPVEQATAILADVADGLAAAHDIQIIHRDLKPENVFVTTQMRVVVLDFTAAKAAGRNLVQSTGERAGKEGIRHVIATPAYMSPEQVRGERVDERTDIYSLGVMAYELLQHHPFQNEDGSLPDAPEMARRHHDATPRPLPELRPEIPADLWALVRRMLSKPRDGRPSRMRDIATELRAIRARYMAVQTARPFSPRWSAPGSFSVHGEATATTVDEPNQRLPSRRVVVAGAAGAAADAATEAGPRLDASAAHGSRSSGHPAAPPPHPNVIHITARRTPQQRRQIPRRAVVWLLVALVLAGAGAAWRFGLSRTPLVSTPAPPANAGAVTP